MSIADKIKQGVGRVLGIGYDGGETSRYRRDLGWGRLTPRDEDNMVGDKTREWLRLKGADLQRNSPVVAGMCNRLETFFVGSGIYPQAKTSDKGWNRAAEQFFQQWALSCDIRQRSSFFDLQAIAVNSRPVSGGIYLELLDNGQMRPIECERIRNPSSGERQKEYIDGVKFDKQTGIILGYWVHNRDENGTFTNTHLERFVPRENMIPVIKRGHRLDQAREIPDLAPVIPLLMDTDELNLYIRNTAKVRSQIIGFVKKLTGSAPNMQPRNQTAPSVSQRDTWRMDWGQMHTMFPQEDVTFPNINAPDPTIIPFYKMQLMLAASAINLPYEFFVFDFSSLDYSRQKGVLLMVNTVRRQWQNWLNKSMNQRVWNWRIAKEMKSGGQLGPAPKDSRGVSEWFKVEWHGEEETWVDRQEANQADILEFQMGVGNLSGSAKRRGRDLEDSLRAKAEALNLAKQIEKEYDIFPGTLINAMIPGQTTPEQNAASAAKANAKKDAAPENKKLEADDVDD